MPNPKRGKAKRRTEPAPSTGEWPRQTLPAAKPPTRQQPARHCKKPRKEQPPTECRPPTTLIVERPTIQKPTTKITAPPPASPTLSIPTTSTMSNAGIIYPIDENGKLIHPDLEDLPGKPTDYDWISYDDSQPGHRLQDCSSSTIQGHRLLHPVPQLRNQRTVPFLR